MTGSSCSRNCQPSGGDRAPPPGRGGTSRLETANGAEVLAAAAGADLFLAAEYHWPTVRRSPRGPVQIVPGGTLRQYAWLTIDAFDDRLELALRRSVTRRLRRRGVWSPGGFRGTDRPAPGHAHRIGTATLRRDGRWHARGALQTVSQRRRR